MPVRDYLHDIVKQALLNDGWRITHDPFTITFGLRRGFVDLGAEKFLAAEKAGRKIAVEIKSFVGVSTMTDLERAIGQYAIYKSWLARIEPERVPYIAVSDDVFEDVFQDIAVQVLLEDYDIKVVVVNAESEEVVRWLD